MRSVSNLPRLAQCGDAKQLLVNGQPFLILGAELQNSSLSSAEYMSEVWPKMAATNINTVLGAVTWEMVEPEEGRFDFKELEEVILGARKHNIHLVLLWFGSFKNGRSTYTPSWVKKDPARFPRVEIRTKEGELIPADTLSPFSEENVKADLKAFRELMKNVQRIDEGHNTVLMVQVENEVGLLFDSRDRSETANKLFSQPVPQELIQFLDTEYARLHADFKKNLKTFVDRKQRSGGWEDIFGESAQTDELFMAYHYATYVERVATAGKEVYPVPFYTNVWQNYAAEDSDNDFPIVVGGGGHPGDYPSGGGTSNVLDIWLQFAPSLDFIAPDVYLNEYDSSCAKYKHKNNPLFIPEQRRDEYGVYRIWKAYGSFQGLCTSPFGIDTLEPATNPFTKHYGLLSQVNQIVLKAQQKPESCIGFYFDQLPADWKAGDKDPSNPVTHKFGNWTLTISRCFVFGKPGAGSGMVLHQGGGRFLLIGWGFHVAAVSTNQSTRFNGILRMEEKIVVNKNTGSLRTGRVLGGDETRSGAFAMMPNDDPDYGGFPIAVTIPARTGIAEVEFYSF